MHGLEQKRDEDRSGLNSFLQASHTWLDSFLFLLPQVSVIPSAGLAAFGMLIPLCARAMVRLVGVYLVAQRIGLRDGGEEAVELGNWRHNTTPLTMSASFVST